MSFDRWKSKDKHTYAFRLFSKYHTYMNSLYWAHVPASSFVQGTYRRVKKSDPVPTTHQLLHISGKDAFRVAKSAGDYSHHLDEFDNWTRLNTLVAVGSYFETYLSSVVSLAIESDLGLLYSIPKKIDGILILKYGNEKSHSFNEITEQITKGTWAQRISQYKKLFKYVPPILKESESDLEKMRILRNNVAHAFGRDIEEARSRKTLSMIPIQRLSQDRLKKYMEMIRAVSRGIDEQLSLAHIGEYELIHFYHQIKAALNVKLETQELKTKINSLYVENRNHNFCKDLIAYYNNL